MTLQLNPPQISSSLVTNLTHFDINLKRPTRINMTDYASLKVPDLKKLLQERGLQQSGNKADLIARLQENDKSRPNPNLIPCPDRSTLTPLPLSPSSTLAFVPTKHAC